MLIRHDEEWRMQGGVVSLAQHSNVFTIVSPLLRALLTHNAGFAFAAAHRSSLHTSTPTPIPAPICTRLRCIPGDTPNATSLTNAIMQ
jgi:hypothetical protein